MMNPAHIPEATLRDFFEADPNHAMDQIMAYAREHPATGGQALADEFRVANLMSMMLADCPQERLNEQWRDYQTILLRIFAQIPTEKHEC
jgi:hypothetical protein